MSRLYWKRANLNIRFITIRQSESCPLIGFSLVLGTLFCTILRVMSCSVS
jgi:hypothetical protein